MGHFCEMPDSLAIWPCTTNRAAEMRSCVFAVPQWDGMFLLEEPGVVPSESGDSSLGRSLGGSHAHSRLISRPKVRELTTHSRNGAGLGMF